MKTVKMMLLIAVMILAGCGQKLEVKKGPALDWPEVAVENRPGAYWWWMGSAVDKENITWNLQTMQKASIGGGTIVPIYFVKGYEDRYIEHLSPEFVEMVSHAAKEAKRLGMWVDMTTGTGGHIYPHVKPLCLLCGMAYHLDKLGRKVLDVSVFVSFGAIDRNDGTAAHAGLLHGLKIPRNIFFVDSTAQPPPIGPGTILNSNFGPVQCGTAFCFKFLSTSSEDHNCYKQYHFYCLHNNLLC